MKNIEMKASIQTVLCALCLMLATPSQAADPLTNTLNGLTGSLTNGLTNGLMNGLSSTLSSLTNPTGANGSANPFDPRHMMQLYQQMGQQGQFGMQPPAPFGRQPYPAQAHPRQHGPPPPFWGPQGMGGGFFPPGMMNQAGMDPRMMQQMMPQMGGQFGQMMQQNLMQQMMQNPMMMQQMLQMMQQQQQQQSQQASNNMDNGMGSAMNGMMNGQQGANGMLDTVRQMGNRMMPHMNGGAGQQQARPNQH